jgi:hypothetical protein
MAPRLPYTSCQACTVVHRNCARYNPFRFDGIGHNGRKSPIICPTSAHSPLTARQADTALQGAQLTYLRAGDQRKLDHLARSRRIETDHHKSLPQQMKHR